MAGFSQSAISASTVIMVADHSSSAFSFSSQSLFRDCMKTLPVSIIPHSEIANLSFDRFKFIDLFGIDRIRTLQAFLTEKQSLII